MRGVVMATTNDQLLLSPQLDALQQTVVTGLQALPGATALYLFGSRAEGRGDSYSDLDIQVITANPGASRAACVAVLGHIHPLALVWDMETTWGAWAATLLFADTSPYHKVDFGLTDLSDHDRWREGEGTWAIKLWEQGSSSTRVPSAQSVPFAPTPGTYAHFVVGQMLGVTRYVKARKRGQTLTAWRFASALADAVVALLNTVTHSADHPIGRPTTHEYMTLDQTLTAPARDRFLTLLDFSTSAAMDYAVYRLLCKLVAMATDASGTTDEAIPGALAAWLLAFVQRELAVPDCAS